MCSRTTFPLPPTLAPEIRAEGVRICALSRLRERAGGEGAQHATNFAKRGLT